jgi:diaminohydroxyphosphoribosylaminopyrimidine deaminase / 5-amino-6-(5-phosphoribosylamino)uracil reductase
MKKNDTDDIQSPDEQFIREALALARKGAGSVSPNPMVGAVVVKDGKVIARGYHKMFGGPHAEVNAIDSVRSVRGATVYVNLEPCNFYGKTPPCTDLLVRSGVARVVVGMRDPNPRVAGKGIAQLRRAGIEVREGVCADECRELNEAFTTFITTGFPLVTLKVAQSIDGKILSPVNRSKWITGEDARRDVHLHRAHYDAVLVGAGTIAADNPQLTVRKVQGRNPVRIILDGNFSIAPSARVLSARNTRTICCISAKSAQEQWKKLQSLSRRGVEFVTIPASRGHLPLRPLLKKLGRIGISSILVEGGGEIFSAFLNQGAADRIIMYIAPKIFGKGLDPFGHFNGGERRNFARLSDVRFEPIGDDLMITGRLKGRE